MTFESHMCICWCGTKTLTERNSSSPQMLPKSSLVRVCKLCGTSLAEVVTPSHAVALATHHKIAPVCGFHRLRLDITQSGLLGRS
jgi:hypothetical protein